MKFDRLRHPELDKSKPYIISQFDFVRSFAAEAAQKNMWYEFRLPPLNKEYVRVFAGIAPRALNSFFASPPTAHEIEAAKQAILQPDFLTNPSLQKIASKRLYQPEQWLTTNVDNAQTDYSQRGFVLAIDLPDSTLSRYVELSSGKKNEVAFKVPRVLVRSAIVQIYRFGPKSYKYFQ